MKTIHILDIIKGDNSQKSFINRGIDVGRVSLNPGFVGLNPLVGSRPYFLMAPAHASLDHEADSRMIYI